MRRAVWLAWLLAVGAPHPSSPARHSPAVPEASSFADPVIDHSPAFDEAFARLRAREFRDAERLFADLSEQPGLTDLQRARALSALARARISLERRADAVVPIARARELALATGDRREIAWTRWLTGVLAYGDGHIGEANAHWTAALDDFTAVADTEGQFEALEGLSYLVTGLARRPLLERALAVARANGDPLLEARARRRWGHALLEAAHPGPALVELERAVALLRPQGRRGESYIGDTAALLGWALRVHGAFERAVGVHEEVLQNARDRSDLNAQVWNYLGLGTSLAELGEEDRAQEAISRGLEAALRTGTPTNVRFLAEADAWIALRRRQWARAASMLEESLAMPGIDSSVMVRVHLSHAYRELGRLDDALASATAAAESARAKGIADNEIQALIELGAVRDARGELDAAEAVLTDVIARLESYRALLAPMDFLKQGFASRFVEAYILDVDLLMRRGRHADALAVAERSRSRAFADLLATRRLAEAEEAETASGRWALGAGDSLATQPPPLADSLRWIPALDSAELATVARQLNTTLVVYWVQETASYAWVVRPDGHLHAVTLRTRPAALRRAVQQAVDKVPDAVLDGAGGRVQAAGESSAAYHALYRILWKPIEPYLPVEAEARITILPHGPLFTVPFGALVDDRGRYLIERFALHYAPSGAVLAEAVTRVQQLGVGAGAHALLVADPNPTPPADQGVRLRSLAAARSEVRAIGPMMPMPADLLIGRAASEPAVRGALTRARVIHFATHAIVRDRDPLGSHLLLAPGGPGPSSTESDGRLTAAEVAALRLSSDLVVLGACRSARGAVTSDGIAGFTRAFMTAGAPSVVATLWDVADVPTSRLMTSFYRAYLAGVPKDRALRAAQLKLLRDLRAGRVTVRVGETTIAYPEHPYVWAGAILVGAP